MPSDKMPNGGEIDLEVALREKGHTTKKYIPTIEEEKKAENSMTWEQWKMSSRREYSKNLEYELGAEASDRDFYFGLQEFPPEKYEVGNRKEVREVFGKRIGEGLIATKNGEVRYIIRIHYRSDIYQGEYWNMSDEEKSKRYPLHLFNFEVCFYPKGSDGMLTKETYESERMNNLTAKEEKEAEIEILNPEKIKEIYDSFLPH